jgi:hypothetical protein
MIPGVDQDRKRKRIKYLADLTVAKRLKSYLFALAWYGARPISLMIFKNRGSSRRISKSGQVAIRLKYI